jgi:hypothetical protein
MTSEQFIRSYGKSAALIFASAAVSYFLTYYSTLSPPIKPRQAIWGMSVIVESVGILSGLNSATRTKPPLRWMIVSIAVYFMVLFSTTFLIPTSESYYREAMGFVCKQEFIELYGKTCYWIDPDILANASFEPTRIWELWSINIVRFILGGLWLVMVFFITSSIAISVRRTGGTKLPSGKRQRVSGNE